jgi:tetratricopeptide (TPR) repeat protein
MSNDGCLHILVVQADPLVYPADIYVEPTPEAKEIEGLGAIYIPRRGFPLDPRTEWEVISGALTGDIPVKLVRLYPPTPVRLEDYILRGAGRGVPINVLHLSCHGAPFKDDKVCEAKDLEEVKLLLENEEGVARPYAAAKLAKLIKDAGDNPPSLVVISACYSGFVSDRETEPIFIKGLEKALTELEAPMPTIIGMTKAVEEDFANWYAAELYKLLSMGIELSDSHERAVERAQVKYKNVYGEGYDSGLPAIVSEGVVGEKPVAAEAGVDDRRVPAGYPPQANPPTTFVGREFEQVAIAGLLDPASPAARDVEGVCVTGPSGMGKSVLAQVVFSRNAWRFTGENDRMAWVRLVAAESADDFLSRVGLALGVRFEDEAGKEADDFLSPVGSAQGVRFEDEAQKKLEKLLAAKKRQVFDSLGSGKNLLVLDDLESVISGGDDAALRILNQLINDRRVFVVMTSEVPSEAAGVRDFELKGLGERAGKSLFVNTLRVKRGEQNRAYEEALTFGTEVKPEVAAICDFLRYEPLMLEQVAANLADDYEPYDAVLRELKRGERKYLKFVGDKAEARHKSQWAAFEYSYDRLPREGTARETLAVAACFAPGVPKELLKDAAPHADELDGDLKLLAARSFVEKGEFGEGVIYRMHPVRADFALEFVGEDLRKKALNAAARVLGEMISNVNEILDAGRFDDARLTAESLVFPNAARLLGEKYAREIERPVAAAVYHGLGYLFHGFFLYKEAEEKYNESLAITEDSGDCASAAITLHELGRLYANTNRPTEAEEKYEASLAIKEKLGDRPGEAQTLHQLGSLYVRTDRPKEAEATYQESLAIEKELGNRAAEAATLHQLGNLYVRTNRPKKAEPAYQESLAIGKELEDRAAEASTLHQLGMLYAKTNRPEEAEAAYKESIAITEELGDRPVGATTLHQLGKLYAETNRPEKAEARYKESLAIEKELGDRAGAAKTLYNLGLLYAKTNRPAEAEEKFKEGLGIFVEFRNRADEAQTLYNLGFLYAKTNRPAEAEATYKKSLAIKEELGDRAGKAMTLLRISLLKSADGDYSGAALFAAQGILFALFAEKADLVEFSSHQCGEIRDKIPAEDFKGIIRAAVAQHIDDEETLEKYYEEIIKLIGI